MLDNPQFTLYWSLAHGQRRRIAEQFGVVRDGDKRLGVLTQAQVWLRRLGRCGSIVPALARARQLHQHELRRIEDVIRAGGLYAKLGELEIWRDYKYHLLELDHAARAT